jgi:hypothetical protein
MSETYPKIVPPNTLFRPLVSGTDSVGTQSQPFSGIYTNNLYVAGQQITFSGLSDSAANIGSGAGIFAQKSGTQLQFKSLVGAGGTIITTDANNVYVSGGAVLSVNGQTGIVNLTTADIPESGSNQYFTTARSRASISGSSPIIYNSGTGVISIQSGSSTQNGYISSGDWSTFNNKQTSGNYVVVGTATTLDQLTLTGDLLPDNSGISYIGSPSATWGSLFVENIYLNQELLRNVSNANVIRIATDPNAGQFSSIASGVASISGASINNPYVIWVEPGVYQEPLISLTEGMHVVGRDQTSVIIQPTGNNSLFDLNTNSSLAFLSIQNTASGYYGVDIINPGDYITIHKVSFVDCDCAMKVEANDSNQDNQIYLEYVDSTQDGSTSRAFEFVTVSGTPLQVSCENFYVYGVDGLGNPPIGILASGSGLNLSFRASALLGTDGNGIGIQILDGANVKFPVLGISKWASGVSVPQYGLAPSLKIFSTSFDNNTIWNLDLQHSGLTGFSNTYSPYELNNINTNSSFFFVNKDEKIITVSKKGGDFDSINDALTAITDNNSNNRYIISVGPGLFIENQITLKPYVSVVGQGDETVVQSLNANDHVFVGNQDSEIKNILITGASGVGASAIYYSDPSGLSTKPLIVENCKMGQNYTHFEAYGINNAPTYIQVNNCRLGSTYPFTYGYYAHKAPATTSIARITVRNNTTTGMTNAAATSGVFYVAGSGCEIASNASFFRTGFSSPATSIFGARAEDGGTLRLLANNFNGFGNGIWTYNAGDAPTLAIDACTFESTTTHLNVQHPGTKGSVIGILSKSKCSVDPLASISVIANSQDTGEVVVNGQLYLGDTFTTSQYSTPLIFDEAMMGLMEGGVLSYPASGLSVVIASGNGYAYDPVASLTKYITWSGQSLPLPASSDVYVYINYNGIPSQNANLPDTTENILLGRTVTTSTSLDFIESTAVDSNHWQNDIDTYLRRVFGAIYVQGSLVSSSGLNLSIGDGEYYFSQHKFTPTASGNFPFAQFYHWSGVGGGWYASWNSSGIVDNARYDMGSGLTALSAGYYTKHALWVDGPNNIRYLVYGNAQYSGLTLVQEAPETLSPPSFRDAIVHVADIIVQQGSGSIIEVRDTRPIPSFKGAEAASTLLHGNLLGLGNDDHTQYLLSNGSRSMSGDLNIGGNNIINVANVDGVDVSAHASRHLPNGLDAITTAAPDTNLDASTINYVGIQNSLARSDHRHAINTDIPVSINTSNSSGTSANLARADHVHAHGSQTDGTLHSIASSSHNGFLASGDWAAFNNKVSKSGDTMSGNLIIFNSNIILSGTSVIADPSLSSSISLTNTSINIYGGSNGISTSGSISPTVNNVDSIGSISNKYKSINASVISGNNIFANGIELFGTSGTSPISVLNGLVSISQSNFSTNGYLSSGDWVTFNNKQPSGNYFISGTTSDYVPEGLINFYYTDAKVATVISGTVPNVSGISPIAVTSGVVSIYSGSSTQNGYISSGDWITFNSKQPSGNYVVSGSSTILNILQVSTLNASLVSGTTISGSTIYENGLQVINSGIGAGIVTVSQNGGTLTISGSSYVLPSNVVTSASNSGTGFTIYNSQNGGDLVFNTISGLGAATVRYSNGLITVSGTDTGEANTASNLGSGYGWFDSKSGVNFTFKSITSGTNIILTNSPGSDIQVGVSSTPSFSTVFANVVSGTTVSGNSINASSSLTLNGINVVTSGTSSGTGFAIFNSKNGNNLVFNTISGLGSATVNYSNGLITISGTDTGEVNTASNIGSGQGVFAQKSGVDLQFRSLLGAGSVSLISGINTITISGTNQFTSPSTTTDFGIVQWSGTTGAGFRDSLTTINSSGSITLASGANYNVSQSGVSNLGSSSSTIATVFADRISTPQREYVFSYDTNNQTIAQANTFQDITFSNNGPIDGFTHIATSANFVANKDGVYLVTYKANVEKTANPNSTIEFRGLFNGGEIAGSQSTELIVSNNTPVGHAGSFIFAAVSGQTFKLQMAGTTTTTRIRSGLGNATTKPSISITIDRLGV